MSDNRNDLPPVNAPNFLERVREALSVYLGNRGDKLDRGVTLRDLSESGVVSLKPGYTAGRIGRGSNPINGVGSAVSDPGGAYTADLTPPPMPTGFMVGAAITSIFIEHDAANYKQGHGHRKTALYGATWVSGEKPVFANAVKLAEFTGSVYSHPTNPATTWHLWIKWVSVDGVESLVQAGGTTGLVATTGQDVGLLLEALTGEISTSELASGLNSRINLIDGGSASTVLPYPLIDIAASQTALNQSIAAQLNDMSSDLLDNIVTISNTNTRVADAGIYLDAGTGTVKISGLEATNASLSTVETRMSAAESSITLKATYTYVDNAIATAVIDPGQVPVFGALEARINTAETDIDALDAAVTLRATTLQLDSTNVRMTTAESDIDALNGTITNKVDTATFTAVTGGLDTRMGTAESTLTTLGDTSSIRQIVEQTHRRDMDSNRDAEATLQTLLAGVTETNTRVEEVALARSDLTATIEAGLSAEASARLALATTVNNNYATLTNDYYTKSSTDGAIAGSATTVRAYADAGDAVVDARVTTVETTKIGYCTIGGVASDHTTKSTCEGAGGVWNVGVPMASAVKQVSVSDGAGSATLEQRFTAQKSLDDQFKAQYSVKLDVNGYVAGFGLYNAGTSSQFIVNADKFAVTTPSAAIGTWASYTSFALGKCVSAGTGTMAVCKVAGTSGGSAPNFAQPVGTVVHDGSAEWQISSRTPIAVLSSSTTIDGSTILPGVYIDGAAIRAATISSAQIGELSADLIKTGTFTVGLGGAAGWITSQTVTTTDGTGKVTAKPSTDYNATWNATPGYYLGNQGGTHKFYVGNGSTRGVEWDGSALTVRGTVYASAGTFTGTIQANAGYLQGLEIRNSSGTVVLNSGNTPNQIFNSEVTLGVDGATGRVALNGAGGGGVNGVIMPGYKINGGNVGTYIADATIGTAHIVDLSVNTLKIAGAAVTVPTGCNLTARSGNGGWQEVGSLTVNVNVAGSAVTTQFLAVVSYASGVRTVQFILEWWINGSHYTNICDTGPISGAYSPLSCGGGIAQGSPIDNNLGNHTFRLMFYGQDSTVSVASGTFVAMGVKR